MAHSTISLAEFAVNGFLSFSQEQVLIRCQGDYRASCAGSGVNYLLACAGDTGLIPGLGRSPEGGDGNPLQYACLAWRRKWQPTPICLPGESHGQTSLAGFSPWVTKSRTWLCDYHFPFFTSAKTPHSPSGSVNRAFISVFHWVRKQSILLIFQILCFILSTVQWLPSIHLHTPFLHSLYIIIPVSVLAF